MNKHQAIIAKNIAGSIEQDVWYIRKVVQATQDADLSDVTVESITEPTVCATRLHN